jgi:transposase
LWEQVPPAAQAALLAVLARSEQRLAEQHAQSDDLRQRLNTNSTNSSKPPSSDGPQVKRPPAQPRSGRPTACRARRRGQPGHPRQQLPLLEPTQTHALEPDSCRRCGRPLGGADPQPLRWQVLELPEVKPEVIEYPLHRLACPCCGITTCGQLPPEAGPPGAARGRACRPPWACGLAPTG